MAKINAKTPYNELREQKVIASLVYGNFSAPVNRSLLGSVKPDVFSPKRRALVSLLVRSAKEGHSLAVEHLEDHVDQSLLPTEFVDRYTDPREVGAALASLKDGSWVAKAQSHFEKIQTLYTTGDANTDGAQALLDAMRPFQRALDEHLNGENVVRVKAFAKDRIENLLKVDTRAMYPTGISSIDKMLGGGVQARRMLLLSSNAKGAKTTMACSMAASMAQAHIPVRYISLEVPAEDIERRIASKLTGAVHRDLWTREVLKQWTAKDQQDWKSMLLGMGLDKYLQIVDGSSSLCNPDRVIEEVSSMGRGVVIVDHVGLIDDSGTKDSNYRFRVKLMEDLHRAIQKQNAALITVAQLNDEGKLAAAKQQNQSVDYHLSWVLGDLEHDSRICRIDPLDFRIPADRHPLYFRLDFDHQSFLPLSEESQEVIEYIEAKANSRKKTKVDWKVAQEEGL